MKDTTKLTELLRNSIMATNDITHILYNAAPSYRESYPPLTVAQFFAEYNASYPIMLKSLTELCRSLKQTKYNQEHLVQRVYELENLQFNEYIFCNSKVLLQSVIRQNDNIRKYQDILEPHDEYKGSLIFYHDTLFHSLQLWAKVAHWKEINIDGWPMGHARRKIIAKEVYGSARFLRNRMTFFSDITIPPLSIFQLRQAIELRVMEILHVADITESGRPVLVSAERLLDQRITKNFLFPVDISCLIKIHAWTNLYIHKGYIDDYWLIEFAQHYLADFFFLNPFVLKDYYNYQMESDIISLLREGPDYLVHFQNRADHVILVDTKEQFEQIDDEIKKKGFSKYCNEKEAAYMERLMQRRDKTDNDKDN